MARRGYHLSREYAVDPLEILFVREVMRTKVVVLSATSTLGEMWHSLRNDRQEQRLLPVVNTQGQLAGVLTRGDILRRIEAEGDAAMERKLGDMALTKSVQAYPDEPLRIVVYRMAEKGFTRAADYRARHRKLLGTGVARRPSEGASPEPGRGAPPRKNTRLEIFIPGGRVREEAHSTDKLELVHGDSAYSRQFPIRAFLGSYAFDHTSQFPISGFRR